MEGSCGKKVKATRYGKYDKNGAYLPDPKDGKIYLPLIRKGAFQPVDPTRETKITFAEGYLAGIERSSWKCSGRPRSPFLLLYNQMTVPPVEVWALLRFHPTACPNLARKLDHANCHYRSNGWRNQLRYPSSSPLPQCK